MKTILPKKLSPWASPCWSLISWLPTNGLSRLLWKTPRWKSMILLGHMLKLIPIIQDIPKAKTFWSAKINRHLSLSVFASLKTSCARLPKQYQLTVCSCHVTYAFHEWIHTLSLPECQRTPCSKQARNLKFKRLQLGSNLNHLAKVANCSRIQLQSLNIKLL